MENLRQCWCSFENPSFAETRYRTWLVECGRCNLRTRDFADKEDARSAWNNRPIEESLRARLEAAEEYIQAMEMFNSIEAQPEQYGYREAYQHDVEAALLQVQVAREAWEKAKENG